MTIGCCAVMVGLSHGPYGQSNDPPTMCGPSSLRENWGREMKGQWLGRCVGTNSGKNSGKIMLDAGEVGDAFEGYAYVDDSRLLGASTKYVRSPQNY